MCGSRDKFQDGKLRHGRSKFTSALRLTTFDGGRHALWKGNPHNKDERDFPAGESERESEKGGGIGRGRQEGPEGDGAACSHLARCPPTPLGFGIAVKPPVSSAKLFL